MLSIKDIGDLPSDDVNVNEADDCEDNHAPNVDDADYENDSEATISDCEGADVDLASSDSDDEELVGVPCQRQWIGGHASKDSLSDFERTFARMYIHGKFTEKQGDLMMELVEKCFAPVQRKTKTLMKFVANCSFGHFYYVECPKCTNLATKLAGSEKDFVCDSCKNVFQPSELEIYVGFRLGEQIKLITEQIPIKFVSSSDRDEPLVIRLIATCDGIPLSLSSNVHLYPIVLYIENIEDLNVRNNSYLIASMVITRKKTSLRP